MHRPTPRTSNDMNFKQPGLRGALIFGVLAATVELGIVLWMAYC
jgi:hypothetical protein